MAYIPTGDSATPAPAPRPSGYVPTSDAPFASNAANEAQSEGGFGLFDFVGNVAGEVKDMAQGMTSLVGAGIGDLAGGVREIMSLGAADVDYKMDDIAMALPAALAKDYNQRYGISKFASGDIWGGFQAVLTGLYERPLSAIGDALMVGTAAKIGAKAGMLGAVDETARAAVAAGEAAPSLGQRVLGAGSREAQSLTGAADPITLSLSENPVARLGQQKLYDLMQYGKRGGDAQYIQGKAIAGATDEANRGMLALAQNAARETPLPILRPAVSKVIEKHGVSKALSLMGMSINDATAKGVQEARGVLEALPDDEARAATTSYAMGTEAPLPDMIPSTNPVDLPQVNEPEGLMGFDEFVDPETGMPGFAADQGVSPGLIEAAGQDRNLIHLGREGAKRPIRAPHRLNDTGDSNAVQITVEDMSGGYDAAKRFADARGGQVVAKMDYGPQPTSYDGLHYGVVGADGVKYDLSIATPELAEAQRHWTHVAGNVDAMQAQLDELQAQLDEADIPGSQTELSDGARASIERQMIEIEDEMQAAEVLNANTFNFTRRAGNADAEVGYDPSLAAADRIRNITYNNATRYEVDHGLTYRKQLDRAFGPLRSEKWSKGMAIIENHLAIRIEAALAAGAKKGDLAPIVVDTVERVLGKNNPFTEGIFRSLIDEEFPFVTGEYMPTGLRGAGRELGGTLRTGEKTINPDGVTFRSPRAEGAQMGRLGDEAEAAGGLENVDQAVIDAIDQQFPPEAAAEIAERLTNRLRMDTHTPMVENGEFPTMTWSDLAREQVAAGTPFPQYYPHIKSAQATGDVVMLNQHSANVPSVLESETGRMKRWGGWLYEKGVFERDPIKAYEALYRQVQRHIEFRDSMNKLVDKYGRTVSDNELAAWDIETHGEVLISRNGLNGMVDSRTKMVSLTHEGVMQGKTMEQSTLSALEAVTRDALDQFGRRAATDEIWALPKYVAEQMKKSAKLNMPGQFNFYYDSAMGLWKSSVLSLSPRWVVNNTLGNMVYMLGHRPSAIPRFIGQLMPGARRRFAATFGEEQLALIERDFMHGEDLLTTTQKLARRSERGGIDFGTKIAESRAYNVPPVNAVRKTSHGIRWLNTQIEGAARRGVAIDTARRASITRMGSSWMKTNTLLEDFAKQGTPSPEQWGKVVTEVNRTLGDYLTMSPVESQIIRRFVMPFYAFYRHTAKYLARMPFEHPLKFELLQQIQKVDQEMNPYMPDYLLGATNIGGRWASFGGANPLEAVSENYLPQVTNPLLGLAIQRTTGTDPFGHEYIPPPGAVVELFGGRQYAVTRDSSGNVTGVRPMEGNWMPPLYESLMNMLPQAGLLPGNDPWERSYQRRLLGMGGISVNESYDPATSQYYAVQHQLEALKQAMGQPPV